MQTKKPKQRTVSNVQSLPECGRAVIRKKVYAAFKSGQTKYAAAMKCHVHERTVGRWYAKFAEHGIEAIHGGKRGPKPGGEKHKLSDLQLAELKRIITDRTPDQLKFKFALWSSKAVKELVSRKYGAQICRRTARRYLQNLGFTYKTPIRLAREQNPAKVEAWLKEEYPAIRKKAAAEKGTIFWADESSVLTCETKVRGYSPKGTAPVLRTSVNRSIRCNMISAVSNRGDMRRQQPGRHEIYDLRGSNECRCIQGFPHETEQGNQRKDFSYRGQSESPSCQISYRMAGEPEQDAGTLLSAQLFSGTESR